MRMLAWFQVSGFQKKMKTYSLFWPSGNLQFVKIVWRNSRLRYLPFFFRLAIGLELRTLTNYIKRIYSFYITNFSALGLSIIPYDWRQRIFFRNSKKNSPPILIWIYLLGTCISLRLNAKAYRHVHFLHFFYWLNFM